MKNPHVERLKWRARQYHRLPRAGVFEGGVKVLHCYDGLAPDRLTWWDDAGFILNDYRVALAWHHPRMAFQDAIDEEVDRLTMELPFDSVLRNGEPVYRTLGKSRKKMTHTIYQPLPQTAQDARRKQVRQQVTQSITATIRPSLQSRWCPLSRVIELCAPVEVRSEADLRQLVAMTKRLLKRETTLAALFPDYQYSRADWEHEFGS